LKSAGDFYSRLAALLKDRAVRDSRRALGRAEFELAELTAKVGDQKAALEAHRHVLALREALAAEPEADPESQAEVGRSLVALGRQQEAIGQTAEAIASYEHRPGWPRWPSPSPPSPPSVPTWPPPSTAWVGCSIS
jgi:hypothetical protein